MNIHAHVIGSIDQSEDYPLGRIVFEITPENEFDEALVGLARKEPEKINFRLTLCDVPLEDGFLRYELDWSQKGNLTWRKFKRAKD